MWIRGNHTKVMYNKIIKGNDKLFSHFINHDFNNSLFSSVFPSDLKRTDAIPVHKNKD